MVPGLRRTSLASALEGTNLTDLFLTTFSLDEVELYSLAQHLDIGKKAVKVRYDPAAFRGWTTERIVPTSWLIPLRPTARRSQPRGEHRKGRLPPIFHPKIALAGLARGRARLVVGTGNLASSDQRSMSNLVSILEVDRSTANRIRTWARAREPRERSFCLVVDHDGQQNLQLNNRPPVLIFRECIQKFSPEREHWLLAAPFWSTAASRRLIGSDGPAPPFPVPRRIEAFFRDSDSARAFAPALRHLGGSLTAYIPSRRRGRKGMHHKVVAWRGQRGANTRVLLYVGSANLTEAGFLGVSPGTPLSAWNWEAGVLYVGGEELWPVARAAVHADLAWRTLVIPKKPGRAPSDAGMDVDERAQLRVHLRCAIRYTQAEVTRRSWPDPPGAHLLRIMVTADEEVIAKNLASGKSIRIPKGAGTVRVTGVYSKFEPVEIELADIADDPRPDIEASASVLADLLRSLASGTEDEGSDGPPALNGGSGPEGTPYNMLPTDVRFPFGALMQAKGHDVEASRRWLRRVTKQAGKGDVPAFWGTIARQMS